MVRTNFNCQFYDIDVELLITLRFHKFFGNLLIFKSIRSLYSLYYAEACDECAGPISASLRPGNTAPFEEISQLWRAVGNSVFDLTDPSCEP